MSDDNVIRPDFGSRQRVGRVEIDRKGDGPWCHHQFVAVRQNDRTVICRLCAREVDPFDVLMDVARDWEMATHRSAELERLEKRIVWLKEEEKRVKARIRRAADKSPGERGHFEERQHLQYIGRLDDES